MKNSVLIYLKSGKLVVIQDFKHINYPEDGTNVVIEKFDDFYLYDRLLTFVGESSIVTLNSPDIEYIEFKGNFND